MKRSLVSVIRSVSIYKRLLFSFMIVIIAPSLIIGAFTYTVTAREMEQNIGRFASQYLTNINDNMTQNLKQFDEISYGIYLDEEIVARLKRAKQLRRLIHLQDDAQEQYEEVKGKIESRLYHWTDTLPLTINGIEIVTEFDEFTQTDGTRQRGTRLADRPLFLKSPMYKRVVESNEDPFWYVSRDNHLPFQPQGNASVMSSSMSHYRKIRDSDDGSLLGLIIVHVSLTDMSNLHKGEETIDKGNLLLVGNDGKAELSFNQSYQGPYLYDVLGGELASRKQGVISRSLNGRDVLVSFQTSPYTGWTVVSLIPEKSLYAGVYEIRNLIFRVSCIFIGLAFLVSYLVTISISGPLIRLKKSMETVNGGKLDVRYRDLHQDEIGLLGLIFNRMIARLRELIGTIYRVEADKQNEILRRKEAELNELQMQMTPHFLYNTLDIIRWQAMFQENGEGKVSQMLGSFSNLMKQSLIRTNGLVTITEEMEHIQAYCKVLKFHYHERLQFIGEIDADIGKCLIVKFALQPIIENAVVHGMKGNQGSMTIRIDAHRSDGDIKITVSDDGIGMSADKLDELSGIFRSRHGVRKHVGIQNVNERIRLRFGENYGLDIRSSAETGTVVTIRVPYITEQ